MKLLILLCLAATVVLVSVEAKTNSDLCKSEIKCTQTEYKEYVKCLERRRAKRQTCNGQYNSIAPQVVQPIPLQSCSGSTCNNCLNDCAGTCSGNNCVNRCDRSCQVNTFVQPPTYVQPIQTIVAPNPPQFVPPIQTFVPPNPPQVVPPIQTFVPPNPPQVVPPIQTFVPPNPPQVVPPIQTVVPPNPPQVIPPTQNVVPPNPPQVIPPIQTVVPPNPPQVIPPIQTVVPPNPPQVIPPIQTVVPPNPPQVIPPIQTVVPPNPPQVIPPIQTVVPPNPPQVIPPIQTVVPPNPPQVIPPTQSVVPPNEQIIVVPPLSLTRPAQIQEKTSEIYSTSPNVTTIIKLTNIVNNTNIVNVPTNINNTNINNLDLGSNVTGVIRGESRRENEVNEEISDQKCCVVVQPRICEKINSSKGGVRCIHRKHHTCGEECTSETIHAQVRQPCNGPPSDCPPQVAYVPQPQPRCNYQPTWPYVSCGNKPSSCEGCYDHYGYGFQQYYGASQPSCGGCYDDGHQPGSLYRQGPFYQPGNYHVPPTPYSAQPTAQSSCGTGCFGNDRVDPVFGAQSYSPYGALFPFYPSVPQYFPSQYMPAQQPEFQTQPQFQMPPENLIQSPNLNHSFPPADASIAQPFPQGDGMQQGQNPLPPLPYGQYPMMPQPCFMPPYYQPQPCPALLPPPVFLPYPPPQSGGEPPFNGSAPQPWGFPFAFPGPSNPLIPSTAEAQKTRP